MITSEQVRAVNDRVERLLGPFDGWYICEHGPGDGCDCRKPNVKLVLDAARAWGMQPQEIAIVGDKESDVETARNAGTLGIRVGSGVTLSDAVDTILAVS
jgi:histidinol-phosphate phosphatase family protein